MNIYDEMSFIPSNRPKIGLLQKKCQKSVTMQEYLLVFLGLFFLKFAKCNSPGVTTLI